MPGGLIGGRGGDTASHRALYARDRPGASRRRRARFHGASGGRAPLQVSLGLRVAVLRYRQRVEVFSREASWDQPLCSCEGAGMRCEEEEGEEGEAHKSEEQHSHSHCVLADVCASPFSWHVALVWSCGTVWMGACSSEGVAFREWRGVHPGAWSTSMQVCWGSHPRQLLLGVPEGVVVLDSLRAFPQSTLWAAQSEVVDRMHYEGGLLAVGTSRRILLLHVKYCCVLLHMPWYGEPLTQLGLYRDTLFWRTVSGDYVWVQKLRRTPALVQLVGLPQVLCVGFESVGLRVRGMCVAHNALWITSDEGDLVSLTDVDSLREPDEEMLVELALKKPV